MEQRQVRLGDVLDDYCPRERRLTNHAVVALVGSEIKLTRCTACDTEHPYKEARVPPRRQTRLVAALSRAGTEDGSAASPALQALVKRESEGAVPAEVDDVSPPVLDAVPAPSSRVDSVRRPLIRATLSRPGGTPPPARPAPVFTIRENTGRDGGFDRGGKTSRKRRNGRPAAEPNGNKAEGHSGQSARPSGQGKNGSRSTRARHNGGRPDRANKNSSRNRGKSRSR